MLYSTRSSVNGLRTKTQQLKKQSVIGFPVTSETFETQIDTILGWAQQRLSKIVCVANVHMLIEAKFHIGFASILHRADMLTPDGMPLAWVVSWMNKRRQDRVAGMDILLSLCRKARQANVSLFFLGSTPDVLEKMQTRLNQEYPDLPIAGIEDLPFRPLTYAEDMELVDRINQSGAGIVLLSLGCPKQERWINAHKNKINAVMIGVGGVFPVFAGMQSWAPAWVRNNGLEWLYRLIQEPHRLWQRYATTIPLFLLLAAKQIIKVKLGLEPRYFVRRRSKMALAHFLRGIA